eukprot:TRINITY_DN6374_c0_g1_i1.p1 TRINITY_DN6374_c0_g1~~TRINITY_DN6374_c0_g1_i1.p1  ORF type:complete len:557 (-),score=63.49 TRINITY_DN6374_c0_g1_i1:1295-2965(-)
MSRLHTWRARLSPASLTHHKAWCFAFVPSVSEIAVSKFPAHVRRFSFRSTLSLERGRERRLPTCSQIGTAPSIRWVSTSSPTLFRPAVAALARREWLIGMHPEDITTRLKTKISASSSSTATTSGSVRMSDATGHDATTTGPSPTASETSSARERLPRNDRTRGTSVMSFKNYRGPQLLQGIYRDGVRSLDDLSTWPRSLRRELTAHFAVHEARIGHHQVSRDGTQKWLIDLEPPSLTLADADPRGNDGDVDAAGQTEVDSSPRKTPIRVEAVYIPEGKRGTLCVSSQVGCSLSCTFCHTGTQPLQRNLTAGEIVAQVMVAKDSLTRYFDDMSKRDGDGSGGDGSGSDSGTDDGGDPFQAGITNVVFMGQGEPLYNFRNVSKAISILSHPQGFNMSPKRITVSTSGITPAIRKLVTAHPQIGLAISLHSADDDVRTRIMPINRTYPLDDLIETCREVHNMTERRTKMTFEYVCLEGVNDSREDARMLVRLLDKIPCRVNLIPFNPWPGSIYQPSNSRTLTHFADYLRRQGGIEAPIRQTRGRDIMAACGQLNSAVA